MNAWSRIVVFIGMLLACVAADAGLAQARPCAPPESLEAIGADEGVLRELVESCPDLGVARELLGDLHRLAGRFAEAEEQYRAAVSLAPSDPMPFVKLALSARGRGDDSIFEIYADSARALAGDAEIRANVDELLAPPESSDSYSYKDADVLTKGLRIGAPGVRPKAMVTDYSRDFFAGTKGFGANLDILFKQGTTELLPGGLAQVRELGRAIAGASDGEQFLIEGHASSEGDLEFNRALSQRRADEVARVLAAEFGIERSLLDTVGRGIRFPVIERGAENLKKSRRVTVLRLYDE